MSAFFYWWGASAPTANSGLIQVQGSGTGRSPVTLRCVGAGHVSAYVTNETDSVTPASGPLTVPARSLLTVVTRG